MMFPEERVWRRLFSPEMSEYFERYFECGGCNVPAASDDTGVRRPRASRERAGRGWTRNRRRPGGSGHRRHACHNSVRKHGPEVVQRHRGERIPRNQHSGRLGGRERRQITGTRYRAGFDAFEHWDNAVKQGQHAARALLGMHKPFEYVPYSFSDVSIFPGNSGRSGHADRAVIRGDVAKNSFSVWWLKQDCASAAFVLRRPDEERESAEQWVREHHEVSPVLLADASRPLR